MLCLMLQCSFIPSFLLCFFYLYLATTIISQRILSVNGKTSQPTYLFPSIVPRYLYALFLHFLYLRISILSHLPTSCFHLLLLFFSQNVSSFDHFLSICKRQILRVHMVPDVLTENWPNYLSHLKSDFRIKGLGYIFDVDWVVVIIVFICWRQDTNWSCEMVKLYPSNWLSCKNY